MRTLIGRAAVAVVAATTATGCLELGGDDAPVDAPVDPLAEYRRLAADLDRSRVEVLGDGARTLLAAPDRLYWIDWWGEPATLHARLETTGARVDYGFPLGDPAAPGAAVSSQLVLTAARDGDRAVYRAWRAGAAAELVGELALPAPVDEQRYWPSALDGDVAYLVVDDGGGPALHRWRPAEVPAVTERLFALADAGVPAGALGEVGVAYGLAVIVESGRVWRVDLARRTATWVRASTEAVGAISIDPAGILVETADALLLLRAGEREPVDITRALARTRDVVPSFATGHHFVHGAALRKGRIVYVGQVGVFRHDLATGATVPLALSPVDGPVRIDYRDPVWLDSGRVHVIGLTSTSGATGATGPVYLLEGGER